MLVPIFQDLRKLLQHKEKAMVKALKITRKSTPLRAIGVYSSYGRSGMVLCGPFSVGTLTSCFLASLACGNGSENSPKFPSKPILVQRWLVLTRWRGKSFQRSLQR